MSRTNRTYPHPKLARYASYGMVGTKTGFRIVESREILLEEARNDIGRPSLFKGGGPNEEDEEMETLFAFFVTDPEQGETCFCYFVPCRPFDQGVALLLKRLGAQLSLPPEFFAQITTFGDAILALAEVTVLLGESREPFFVHRILEDAVDTDMAADVHQITHPDLAWWAIQQKRPDTVTLDALIPAPWKPLLQQCTTWETFFSAYADQRLLL